MKAWVIGGICVAVVGALALALALAAGSDLFAQDGPFGGDGPGGRGMPRMPRMGGGGGVAMTTLGKYLYVVNGSTLFKVDPDEMKVVKQLELKSDRPDMPGGDDKGAGRKGW